ncbi:MAG: CZB domain-containing protein [Polyangiaceae bacterium]
MSLRETYLRGIVAHSRWKWRLRNYVDGKSPALDAALAEKDDGCELGRWLRGDAGQVLAPALRGEVLEKHAAFHRAVADLVRLVQAGRHSEARAALGCEGGYAAACSEFLEAVVRARDASR